MQDPFFLFFLWATALRYEQKAGLVKHGEKMK